MEQIDAGAEEIANEHSKRTPTAVSADRGLRYGPSCRGFRSVLRSQVLRSVGLPHGIARIGPVGDRRRGTLARLVRLGKSQEPTNLPASGCLLPSAGTAGSLENRPPGSEGKGGLNQTTGAGEQVGTHPVGQILPGSRQGTRIADRFGGTGARRRDGFPGGLSGLRR